MRMQRIMENKYINNVITLSLLTLFTHLHFFSHSDTRFHPFSVNHIILLIGIALLFKH